MPLQDIVTGKNCSIQLLDGFGNIIQLNRLKSFHPRYMTEVLKSQDFNGTVRHKTVYNGGIEGDLEFEQMDDTLDVYFAVDQAAYLTGSPQQYNTIIETINYASGQTAQFLYNYIVLSPGELGNRVPDQYVMRGVKWYGSERIKLK